jgi:tRNA threonylcarbamoyladenosine biosynthesis protein TsaB
VKTLALELSSAVGSLAWCGADELVRAWPNDRRDSAAFFRTLAEVQKTLGMPDRIVVGLGPGSYAGTRIAISAAVGLSTCGRGSVQLAGYPSICAIPSEEEEYCVVGDARRQSFFFARVVKRALVEGPILLSGGELAAKLDREPAGRPIFTTQSLPQFPRAKLGLPSAQVLAQLGEDPSHVFAAAHLEPIYLREPHITFPGISSDRLADERKTSRMPLA